MAIKVKSKKWYGRFWPPERKKIRIMQAIIDYKEEEIMEKVEKQWRDQFIYGVNPTYTSYDDKIKQH